MYIKFYFVGDFKVNYFIVNNINHKITGIEKSVMNRLKLFNDFNLEAKIITLAWNSSLHKNAHTFGVSKQVFSMYDFFQESINVQINTVRDWIAFWEDDLNYEIKYVPNTNDLRVYHNGTRIIYASFRDSNYKLLDYVNYFDTRNVKMKREYYDSRGFLSRVRYMRTKEMPVCDTYLTPSGKIKLEVYFDPYQEKEVVTRIMLFDYNAKDYTFDNTNELIAFFYEQLYKDGDLFFSDKTAITSPPFLITDKKVPVISVLHSTHVKNNNDIEGSDIKNIYNCVFNHLDRFSGILVSTVQQKKDVEKRIQSKIPVFNIPVGYAQQKEANFTPVVPHGPLKLMSIARYAPEKQLDHQIRLINKLKDDFDQIELHLFGFGGELNKLKELTDSLNLENHIKFRGFIPNITNEMHHFHASMITSNMEGFSLALLESLSNGLPAISYDIPYGPSELIVNGKNGYLVPRNDEDKLYETIKSYLSNPDLQKTFRDTCMTESQKYAQSEIIKKWLHLLGEVTS